MFQRQLVGVLGHVVLNGSGQSGRQLLVHVGVGAARVHAFDAANIPRHLRVLRLRARPRIVMHLVGYLLHVHHLKFLVDSLRLRER